MQDPTALSQTNRDELPNWRTHRELFWPVATIVCVVLIAYWPTLSRNFVRFDDHQYVVTNPLVRRPSWSGVVRFLTEVRKPSTVAGYYQPLTMLSLMIDTSLAGGRDANPAIFHLHNMLLHTATCAL